MPKVVLHRMMWSYPPSVCVPGEKKRVYATNRVLGHRPHHAWYGVFRWWRSFLFCDWGGRAQ
jgi:hypothetical protein